MERTYTLFPSPVHTHNATPHSCLPTGKVMRNLITILLLALTFLFSSCDMMHQPVRGYFEEWTSEVSIQKFEVEGVETYYDKDGNLCIPSDHNAQVTFFMINPHHYDYYYEYSGRISGLNVLGNQIYADPDDTTLLRMTYLADYFLVGKEGGQEIGGTIELEHPKNRTTKAFSYSLKCNSKPPKIETAAIMTADNKYVLAIELPDSSVTNSTGIHRDIESITINGQSYPITINASGQMDFGDDGKFTRTRPSDLTLINKKFESTNAVYFLSGEDAGDDRNSKTYTVGYTDAAGLKTFVTIEARLPGMSLPIVKDNDGNQLSDTGTNTLHIDTDEGIGYSTISIYLPNTDDIDESYSDGQVHWELWKNGNKISSNSNTSNPETLSITEEGEYTLETWASAASHTNSAKKKYELNLVYQQLAAPAVKSGSDVLQAYPTTNYLALGDSGQTNITIEIPLKDINDDNLINSGNTTVTYLITGSTEPKETISTEILQLSQGLYTMSLTASRPGYKDSVTKSYTVRIFSKDIYVKSSGSDTDGDGSNTKPYASLSRAMTDIATFKKTSLEYVIHIEGTVEGKQTIGSNVNNQAGKITLQGSGSNATLDGKLTDQVLIIDTTVPIEIKDLKITRGKTSYQGAGISASSNTNVTLNSGAVISGNETTSSSQGGGGVSTAGKLYIKSGASISGNKADSGYGGGIYASASGAEIYLEGGVIGTSSSSNASSMGNTAKYGGAICMAGGSLTVSSGTIGYNTATDQGGGIHNKGTLSVTGGTIEGNKVTGSNGDGGGIYQASGTGTTSISGGTIKSNKATGTSGLGGAIYVGKSITLSKDANFNPSNASAGNNDIFISSGKKITIGTGGLAYGDVAKITVSPTTTRKTVVLGGGSTLVSANYGKFSVTGDKWKIDSEGKLRLKNQIKIIYDFNITDSSASPKPSDFKLTSLNGTNPTSTLYVLVNDEDLTSTNVLKPSYPGYIDQTDSPKSFYYWEAKVGSWTSTVTTNSSATYPDDFATHLNSDNEITLKANWTNASNADAANVWANVVYNVDYYNNHDTFNVYTAAQVQQIFSATQTGALGRNDKDFDGKTINIMKSIDAGNLVTSAIGGIDGFNAWIGFKGTLNGNGYGITANITGRANTGLFYSLEGGTIMNLGVHGTHTGNSWSGGIVGNMISGHIISCSFDGTITCTGTNEDNAVGGIVGRMFNGTIEGCAVLGSVNGKMNVGGIVGYADNALTVKDSFFYGSATNNGTGSGRTIGKIVGKGTLPSNNNVGSGSISPSTSGSGLTVNTSGY